MYRRTAALTLVAVAALVAVALSGFLGPTGLISLEEQNKTVKVGLLVPLTGSTASVGEDVKNAVLLALEDLGKNPASTTIQLILEDSQCDAKAGVKAINSLVNLKGMKLVIAAECSGPALSAAPIAEQAKILYLVAIASNPAIKYAGDYVFRIAPSDEQQGKDLAELVYSLGYRNAATMFMDNAYGEGIAGVFSKRFEELGGKIAIEQRFNQNDSDFRTQLLKAKEAGPDSLLMIGYPQSDQVIIKQMQELGLGVQVFSADTFRDQSILDALGEQADGIIFSAYAESENPEFEKFRQAYTEKYGKEYGPYGDYAYDSLYVLKAAIEQANSFGPEVLKETMYGLEYNGVTGLTKFDSFGEVDRPYGIFIVENGEFVPFEG